MESSTDFKYRVAQVLSGEYRHDDIVSVCTTPKLVRDVGFSDNQIVMTQKHIRNCLAAEETATPQDHHHNLPIDFMDNLPSYLERPAMVLSSMSQPNSIVVVTDCKDKKDRPIIIALKNAGTGTVGGKVITCNIVTSAYGRNGFSEFLNNALRNNGLLFCDIKKSRDLVVSAGLQLPSLLAKYDSNVIIRRYNENVNTFKPKFLSNTKNYLPEQYGQTLYRPNGLPVAYADEDGRQRLYEYGKQIDGKPYISKTTTTFSDGRTETTEYDARGCITLLERMSSDGRETYRYSSDGYFRSNERSTVYFDVNDYSARKSVHEKTREKKEERGNYYDSTKESWRDLDELGKLTVSKHNVYGDNDRLHSSSEVKYAYDRYGNQVSAVYDDGSVYKTEYFPPSEVRDFFCYDIDDYDAGAIDHNKVKTETSLYPDGRLNVKSYTLNGKYTESEYSPDGKLTSFRDENGAKFQGKAAENALFRNSGHASDIKPKSPSRKTQAKTQSNKSVKGKPSGNGGRGSSGR